jgi:hypothetical protein
MTTIFALALALVFVAVFAVNISEPAMRWYRDHPRVEFMGSLVAGLSGGFAFAALFIAVGSML